MQTLERAEAPAPPVTRRWPGKTMVFWGTAVVIVALDQLTKAIVRTALDVGESWPSADWDVKIKNVTNSGAAFSILQDQTAFLIAMTFFGLAAIYLYYRNPPFQHWVASVAIGMMLGGAIGNLIDRIRAGKVTDFVHVFGFPNFNVADSSISVGVTVIIIGYLLFAERPPNPPESHEDAPANG